MSEENKLPPGWDSDRVKRLIAHYDALDEGRQVVEDEAAQTMESKSDRPQRSRWPVALASIAFSAATFEMGMLYGIVHWQIMFRPTPQAPNPPTAVFTVLNHLALWRLVFAVLAIVWAVWAFRTAPRWIAWVALALALAALGTNLIIT